MENQHLKPWFTALQQVKPHYFLISLVSIVIYTITVLALFSVSDEDVRLAATGFFVGFGPWFATCISVMLFFLSGIAAIVGRDHALKPSRKYAFNAHQLWHLHLLCSGVAVMISSVIVFIIII